MKKETPDKQIENTNELYDDYLNLFPNLVENPNQQWRQDGDIIEEFSLLDENTTTISSNNTLVL